MIKFLKEVCFPVLIAFLLIFLIAFLLALISEEHKEFKKRKIDECQQKTNDFEWCYKNFIK
jgi:hypothetical protein